MLLMVNDSVCGFTFIRKKEKWKRKEKEKRSEVFRYSRLEVFCYKDVLRNFLKLTGNHLCQGPFFNKVAGPSTIAQVFSCEFCKISKSTFS